MTSVLAKTRLKDGVYEGTVQYRQLLGRQSKYFLEVVTDEGEVLVCEIPSRLCGLRVSRSTGKSLKARASWFDQPFSGVDGVVCSFPVHQESRSRQADLITEEIRDRGWNFVWLGGDRAWVFSSCWKTISFANGRWLSSDLRIQRAI